MHQILKDFVRASTQESDQGFMEGAICDYDELIQGEGTLSDDLNINAKCDDNKMIAEILQIQIYMH